MQMWRRRKEPQRKAPSKLAVADYLLVSQLLVGGMMFGSSLAYIVAGENAALVCNVLRSLAFWATW